MTLRPRGPSSPLSIGCPSNITARATSPAGVVVTYSVPGVSGGCLPYTTNCVPASGSTFPIGTTMVNCSVTDACGGQASCSFTVTVLRQLQKRFYQQVLLPPTNGLYAAAAPGVVTFWNGVILSDITHRLFSAGVVPPLSPGTSVTNTCTTSVEGMVSADGGLSWGSVVLDNIPTRIRLTNNGPDSGDTLYAAELLQMDISGEALIAGAMIRESPTLASTGQTRVEATPGGYLIDSFFDIFLEISTDSGGTWWPAFSSYRVQLKPDPALIAPAAAPRTVMPMPNGQEVGSLQAYASGIVLKDIRHKLYTGWMEPPVFGASQTHTFDSQLDFQLSTDGGANFSAARAPATMTVTISNVRGFQGRSTYETEVTQFDIAGGDLPVSVMLRKSPIKASKGGRSSLAGGGGGGAGGGAAISSFFDVFTEITTDGGVSWGPATNGPTHLELCRIAPVHTYTNNLIPALAGEYITPQTWWADYANGIVLTNVSHHSFTAAIPPPPPGLSSSHTFGATLEFDISYDGGLTYRHASAPDTCTVQLTGRLGDDGVTMYYDTEMTQLSVADGGLMPGVQIRESPTKASLGRITSSAVSGGVGGYQTDSFFDIYTEVSTDYGATWLPTLAGPATMTLRPRSVVVPVTPARITSIVRAGGAYTINYTNGGGTQFILLKSPTVNARMSTWTPMATNGTGSGSFSVSPVSATFYRIESR
jgi:hypothetical protein